jgi:lipoate-protein ligase A
MLSAAASDLALDHAQFRAVESGAGQDSLRLWESPAPAVVLGRSGVISRDVEENACAADGVEILRRESGGGAVVLGPGCVIFSLLLRMDDDPELRDARASYCLILKWLAGALDVPGLEIRGFSDLAIGERKVSGNAQRRGARALLHHGTLLCGLDARLMERYLKPPDRQPDYRHSRAHAEFVGNLPLAAAEIMRRVSSASESILRPPPGTAPGTASRPRRIRCSV